MNIILGGAGEKGLSYLRGPHDRPGQVRPGRGFQRMKFNSIKPNLLIKSMNESEKGTGA